MIYDLREYDDVLKLIEESIALHGAEYTFAQLEFTDRRYYLKHLLEVHFKDLSLNFIKNNLMFNNYDVNDLIKKGVITHQYVMENLTDHPYIGYYSYNDEIHKLAKSDEARRYYLRYLNCGVQFIMDNPHLIDEFNAIKFRYKLTKSWYIENVDKFDVKVKREVVKMYDFTYDELIAFMGDANLPREVLYNSTLSKEDQAKIDNKYNWYADISDFKDPLDVLQARTDITYRNQSDVFKLKNTIKYDMYYCGIYRKVYVDCIDIDYGGEQGCSYDDSIMRQPEDLYEFLIDSEFFTESDFPEDFDAKYDTDAWDVMEDLIRDSRHASEFHFFAYREEDVLLHHCFGEKQAQEYYKFYSKKYDGVHYRIYEDRHDQIFDIINYIREH